MKPSEWEKFGKAKKLFRSEVDQLTNSVPELKKILQKFVGKKYTVETPIVYNSALDKVTQNSEIKLILVADNPGRHEQEIGNRCYLVDSDGRSAGHKAREFFNTSSSYTKKLEICDFEKNVIVLNKTPIHSPSTDDLRQLRNIGILEDSQKIMAKILFEFHKALNVPVWIIGKSKMGNLFKPYTDELKSFYLKREQMYKQIYFYHHFSRSCFTKDLKGKDLESLGKKYREEVLGKIVK